ncbi:ATP-binding protein [Streptomyces sp. NPDC017943]|uniref:ATP-binding protein n=1 Tax=Streptomyces sp. NPDC017943 TaxID=3365019 RepID=UPI0037936E17
MVIPLMKQADEQGRNDRAALHFGAAWAEGTACAVDARRALRAFLAHAPHTGRSPAPDLLALDAELVVSELVTNAIRHAPGPCGLILWCSDDELVVTVWDSSRKEPVVRERDGRRFGGHGMHVVHTVSSAVVVTVGETGKRIVARIPFPPGGDAPGQEGGGDTPGPGGRTVLPTSLSGRPPRQP